MTASRQHSSHRHPFHARPFFLEDHNEFFRDHPFFRGGPPPPFLHHGPRGRSPAGYSMLGPLRFLRHLAFATLAMFCISMVFRSVAFLLAVLFSPPVLLVCLVTMVAQSWEQHPFCRDFNVNRFHQAFFGPGGCRRLRRSCGMNKCGGERNQQYRCRPGQSNTTWIQDPTSEDETTPRFPENPSSSEAISDSVRTDLQRHSPRTNYQNIPVHREETEDFLTLALDIPGYTLDDIKVTMESGATLLCINGERKNRIGDTFAIQEKFALDEEAYNLDSIHANLSDGVLEIRIQKKPVPQPRMISISTKKDDWHRLGGSTYGGFVPLTM